MNAIRKKHNAQNLNVYLKQNIIFRIVVAYTIYINKYKIHFIRLFYKSTLSKIQIYLFQI